MVSCTALFAELYSYTDSGPGFTLQKSIRYHKNSASCLQSMHGFCKTVRNLAAVPTEIGLKLHMMSEVPMCCGTGCMQDPKP